jgi:hypothetical protein
MSTRLFEIGREKLADDADWDTDTIKMKLLDLATTDTMVKAITAITNASPMVVTSNSHGFSDGDPICIYDVLGITAANGTWQVASSTANTFALKTLKDGLNSTGNAAYTSGGKVINLKAANLGQIDGGSVGTDQTLGSKTLANGVLDAADPTFPGFTGNATGGVIYKDTGSAATSPPLVWNDGKQQVVVAADAASSATTIWVEPLAGPIANGTVVVFSNGISATLTAGATAGQRTLTVSAISGAIAAGHTADVTTTGAGFPVVNSGMALTVQFDNGANKIAKL